MRLNINKWLIQMSVISAAIAVPYMPAVAEAAPTASQFDIAAGSLDQAITTLGREARIMIAFDPTLVRGKRSKTLHGHFTPSAALERLLAGSGIVAHPDGRGGFTLAPAPSRASRKPVQTRKVNTTGGEATIAKPTEEIVVTGDWLGDAKVADVFHHAGARDVLRRSDFTDTGAVSVRDALSRVPGVNAPTSNGTGNHEMALNFGVRGLNPRLASRSTVLIDGIPLPFAPYGQPQLSFAGVTLGNLDAIDVVRGGGSVRYGPQNVGGIVNFVTRAIPQDFTVSMAGEGAISTKGSNGLRGSANALIGGTTSGGFGAALLYSTVRGPSYRAHSDSHVNDVMLKLKYEIDDRQTVSGILQYYDGWAQMPGGLTSAQYAANPYRSTRPYDSFWGHRWMGGLTYEFRPTSRSEWKTTAFRTHTLRNGYLDQGANITLSPRTYNVTGIESRFSQGFNLGPTEHEISVGYRFIHETGAEQRYTVAESLGMLPSTASTQDRDTRGRTNAHALYVDDRITLGRFTATPGLRYEFIESRQSNLISGAVIQGNYSVPLPALNLSYSPANHWMLFANTMGSFGTVQYSAISVANATHYGPENARTWEAGGRYDDGSLKLEGTLFYIHFKDQYDTNQQTNSITARGETRHQGLELAAAYRFGGALAGLDVYANYTYVDAEILEAGANKGNRLPFSSRHSGNFGANYRYGPWTFNIDGRAQSSQFADAENTVAENAAGNTGLIPGFMVFGSRVEHRFDQALSGMTLGLGVRNIFDRRYFTRSYDDNNLGKYVEEPRTIYVQASVKL